MTSSARSSLDALRARLGRLVPDLDGQLAASPDGEPWLALIGELDAAAPRLADTCARASIGWLGRVPIGTLGEWIRTGRAVGEGGGWRAERRARAFFEAPEAMAVLEPPLLARWSTIAARFGKALDDARFFALLDAAVGGWSTAERRAFLDAVDSVARRDPRVGAALYRELAGDVDGLPSALRSPVLGALAAAAPVLDLDELARVRPILRALLRHVPGKRQNGIADVLTTVAREVPIAVVGLLRTVPRLVELAHDDARLVEWTERGVAIARDNDDAAIAYFALASRTSERILTGSPTAVSLAEVQGELRKFIQMLSGTPAVPLGDGVFRLRSPLESDPAAGIVTIPDTVDALGTYEDNARLYRLLAALVAGRREQGTYVDPTLAERLDVEGEPTHLSELVRLTDGYRVATRLGRAYGGLARELAWAAERLVARAADDGTPALGPLLDAILALALLQDGAAREVPAWLAAVAAPVLAALRPLAEGEATIDDAIEIARQLAPLFDFAREPDLAGAVVTDLLPLLLDDDDGEAAPAPEGSGPMAAGGGDDTSEPTDPDVMVPEELVAELEQLLGPEGHGAHTLSPEDLARLIEAGLGMTLKQARGRGLEQTGLYVTQLLGKLLGDDAPELPLEDGAVGGGHALVPRQVDHGSAVFVYDEWDHRISDYRPRWCRLREVPVAEDAGVFYDATLTRHAELVPEIRRHFQRVRPELYRTQRGLEDGEDFDLGALVDARAELRARRTPSPKLYTARTRQERDVATLFLLDLSASTDEAAGEDDDGRIIDVTREALVLMAAALDEIGDAFAVYGFSGQGRENVEFFRVKDFGERLTPAVKARIGGLEPRGSTRMGTAIRHAVTKMRGLTAPSRHLILLSDGFPQDLDYGQDRHSHTYGIRDTATALREAESAGIRPFCITVDAAGHDYLRQMCSPHAYMVIDTVTALPRELPKIYQRLVWAA